MTHDDDSTEPYAGDGPYWTAGTTWGTPATDPSGQLFPHGQHTSPSPPDDGDIQKIIEAAIRRDSAIPAGARIAVRTDHGVVTLTGEVSSEAAKHAAGDAAWYAP